MTSQENAGEVVERYLAKCREMGDAGDGARHKWWDDLAALITSLVSERDRCHARLEIDHYYVMGENDDLVRREVPPDQRHTQIDGIECRDATISVLEQDLAAAERHLAEAREALKPFADYAPYVSMFVEGRAAQGGSPILPTKHFRRADFERAASVLANLPAGDANA